MWILRPVVVIVIICIHYMMVGLLTDTTWEESLKKGLALLGGLVVISVGDCLKLTGMERPKQLWEHHSLGRVSELYKKA